MTWFLLIVVGGLLALGLWWVGTNNRLVAGRNAYRNAFAQIDVQLTRRHDLIPNLVETARAYMAHERDTLEAVIRARSAAVAGLGAAKAAPGEAGAMAQLAGAEGQLTGALSRLLVTVEAYPELKASTTMQQLAEELGSTENRLAFARQAYNDAVMAYNNRREMFPASLVASQGGFAPAALLEITADEAHKRLPPRVQF
ncbi:LemA family protein [Silanimonas sp.]|uniref:LemA family protein n=1 Tax=Silanimonas sp. TaxID=1929290 RepID=UPI001BC6B215|nr:LemA family protein [Silanimonas sp.]MBS3897125.1 LemA family protein [Silanimonas sp.]MBS3923810.1 LemA family protein [Xanthomonadaceae bacterium]